MKYSLIVTTKNEEKTIAELLDSVAKQSILPNEVIIADAASDDETCEIIEKYNPNFRLELINVGNVNRSIGRNRAIEHAHNDLILITDAGCRLDKNWAHELIITSAKSNSDITAGYYQGVADNVFEACVIPYVLVMPDKVDPVHFLPATRSMAIHKSVWEEMGGFDEKLRYAEDYAFARRLEEAGYKMAMAPKAIVYWQARPTLKQFSRMIYEHARGDGYSHTWRPKVILIFLRYLVSLVLIAIGLWYVSLGLIAIYLAYAIAKNYHYVHHIKALFYLPLLQVTSDLAVMFGTIQGVTMLQ